MYVWFPRSDTNMSSHLVVIGPLMMLFPPSVGHAYHEKAPLAERALLVDDSAGSCKLGSGQSEWFVPALTGVQSKLSPTKVLTMAALLYCICPGWPAYVCIYCVMFAVSPLFQYEKSKEMNTLKSTASAAWYARASWVGVYESTLAQLRANASIPMSLAVFMSVFQSARV